MAESLRIGTRGSGLALAQTGWVAERLRVAVEARLVKSPTSDELLEVTVSIGLTLAQRGEGVEDLLNLILRPTPRFMSEKREIYEERIRSKGWLCSWPMLSRADG